MNSRCILLAVSSSCSDALDGSVFASLPLDRETIQWLSQRSRCFLNAREVYPDLYETYEFDGRLKWYDTGAGKEYDDQVDRDKLQRLTDDVAPFDDSRRAELDKLDAWQIPWIVIPAEELPTTGNLRTECDQLVMSLRGNSLATVELRWVSYIKHTDVELRTFDISSEDIARWLGELGTVEPASNAKPSEDQPDDPAATGPTAAELEVLEAKARELGLASEDLDDVVHDIASEVASSINNQGLYEQIAYWASEGWATVDAIKEELTSISREKSRHRKSRAAKAGETRDEQE